MSKQKKSILPSIEIIIVLVFFLSFIIWAVSKCNATKEMLQEQAINEIVEEEDPTTDPSEAIRNIYDSITSPSTAQTGGNTGISTPNTPPLSTATAPSNSTNNLGNNSSAQSSILYVTIDGLNMRTGPHLDSTIIRKLNLFEEVVFMNEVTDSTQQISLGTEIANEPWVKVKHKRGHVGWVYGAGVNYYKKKR